jgi:hypothetical protein
MICKGKEGKIGISEPRGSWQAMVIGDLYIISELCDNLASCIPLAKFCGS